MIRRTIDQHKASFDLPLPLKNGSAEEERTLSPFPNLETFITEA
jgi:hypothetical protein